MKRSAVLLRRYLFLMVLTAGLAGSVTGCVSRGVNPVSGNKRVYGYSWDKEKKLGAQSDKQVRQQYSVYDDRQMQQYVDRVGQRVLAESDLRRPDTPAKFKNTKFHFTMLASPVVNAFALPGGYVYVTRGLMTHVNNEAQLAVVIGHEITHVAARHSSAQAGKQQLGQLGLLLGGLGAQAAGLPGGQIMQLGQQASQLLFLKYSRDNEREADAHGVEYAARAGYDTEQAAGFFHTLARIQEKAGQSLPTWQSTHPDPGDRQQRVHQLSQKYAGQTGNRVGQDEYLSTIDGLIMGDNPRKGYVENNTFYHPELKLQFPIPRGFAVNNTNQAVVMVDQNQGAQLVFTQAQGASARGAAQQAAQQLSQQTGVRITDDGSARSSGDLPAYYLLVEGRTQQGTIRALFYYVEYDGQVYVFQGASSARGFSRYQDVFLNTMRGFGPLRDRSRLDVQPVRLDVQRADRSAPFRSFVRGSYERADLDEQDLAIINQVELGETIQRGQPLKLPQR